MNTSLREQIQVSLQQQQNTFKIPVKLNFKLQYCHISTSRALSLVFNLNHVITFPQSFLQIYRALLKWKRMTVRCIFQKARAKEFGYFYHREMTDVTIFIQMCTCTEISGYLNKYVHISVFKDQVKINFGIFKWKRKQLLGSKYYYVKLLKCLI